MKVSKLNAAHNSIFLGIDVHKKTYHITITNLEGERLESQSIPACPETLVKFLKKKYRNYDIHSAYEAGFSGFELQRTLKSNGINSIVFNPASLPIASNDRVKTDKLDSLKIARSLLLGVLNPIHIPSRRQEASRTLSRTRKQLVETRTSLANQIKAKLYEFGFIEASDDSVFSLKWLENILCSQSAQPALKISIKALAGVYKSVSSQITELEKQMALDLEKHHKDDATIVQSVPGVGPVSASVILNEIGNIGRFTSVKKVYSFTGLTPSEYSSGDKQRFGNISRKGNARLRGCLTEVAWRAIQKDKGLRAIYERLKKKAGAKKAILAVARRLMGRIRACLINNEMYNFSEV